MYSRRVGESEYNLHLFVGRDIDRVVYASFPTDGPRDSVKEGLGRVPG